MIKLRILVHEAEGGGYCADVPPFQDERLRRETFEELLTTIYEVVEACLSVDVKDVKISEKDRVLEIAV